jgi:hypothetical protein
VEDEHEFECHIHYSFYVVQEMLLCSIQFARKLLLKLRECAVDLKVTQKLKLVHPGGAVLTLKDY